MSFGDGKQIEAESWRNFFMYDSDVFFGVVVDCDDFLLLASFGGGPCSRLLGLLDSLLVDIDDDSLLFWPSIRLVIYYLYIVITYTHETQKNQL